MFLKTDRGMGGPVDQLGDRLHGMEKAEGSSPFRSTNFPRKNKLEKPRLRFSVGGLLFGQL